MPCPPPTSFTAWLIETDRHQRPFAASAPLLRHNRQEYAQSNENDSAPGRQFAGCPAAASKATEKALRHAASFHDHIGEATDQISGSTMAAGIALASYNLRRWIRYMQVQIEPAEHKYARMILKCLKQHLQFWRPELVRQAYIQPRVHPKASRQPNFELGLDVLELNNYVRREYYPGHRGAVKWLRLNRELIMAA